MNVLSYVCLTLLELCLVHVSPAQGVIKESVRGAKILGYNIVMGSKGPTKPNKCSHQTNIGFPVPSRGVGGVPIALL